MNTPARILSTFIGAFMLFSSLLVMGRLATISWENPSMTDREIFLSHTESEIGAGTLMGLSIVMLKVGLTARREKKHER